MKGTSQELQIISIVGFINDPYILGKCIPEVQESYYSDVNLKLIYSGLKKYYNKYMAIPTKKELNVVIRDSYSEGLGDLDEVSMLLDDIYVQQVTSSDFIYEKITDFIRRNKIERSLQKVVKYYENGDIDLDQVAVDLRDSIYLDFNRSQVFNLSDVTSIKTVREEALGTEEKPVIVKFFINAVNRAMQYKGLIPGTLNTIAAAPGAGKTTVLINQGVSTARQGFRCLHIFLGDMSRFDGLIRYLSCYTGVSSSQLVDLTVPELERFVQKHNMAGILSNIEILAYAANQISANQLIEEISAIQKTNKVHYDVVQVDYDENIKEESDSRS